jgi:hypothetical protein
MYFKFLKYMVICTMYVLLFLKLPEWPVLIKIEWRRRSKFERVIQLSIGTVFTCYANDLA